VNSAGIQTDLTCWSPSISADGRFVVFWSLTRNLVSGDTNGVEDVFVRDRWNGTTQRVSVDSAGIEGNSPSFTGSISADGRCVAFWSFATNLVPGDTNNWSDVFVRDLSNGTTERVSIATNGAQGNDPSGFPSISADGRYVVFSSTASNLVPGDTNVGHDVFIRDRASGTTERISVSSAGIEGNSDSDCGNLTTVSSDGRYVVFESSATNLVSGDTNNAWDVFVRDRQSGTTERVSVSSNGTEADSYSAWATLSADGRCVAFESQASNLVPGDTNGAVDVFVRDLSNGTTERVSVDPNGAQANGTSVYPSISADGRYVAFTTSADNLLGGGVSSAGHVIVHDRLTGANEIASVPVTAGPAGSGYPAISADARYIAFESGATNLVIGDTNGVDDIFVRDRVGGTEFIGMCDPGAAGVVACPCANPPAGPGRGCDNSAATGGAILSASGGTFLSSDSLEFHVAGEPQTALSMLFQGTAAVSTGCVYGQGVRCVAGLLKRLFVKTAVGGGITAPDFGAGDSTVSARSAAKGDAIQAGQSRFYLVYYRDPVVLGGCPASSTFNATQSGQVSWWP
jgi:Tol biopolymer transport system component